MDSWWEIVSVFLLSTVKFVFGGIPLALGFGFSFFEAVTVTSLGGFTGVIFFVFLSDKLLENVKKMRAKKQIEDISRNTKKIFIKKNKIIIKVKHRFGIVGIAFLTPLLLSIPLGCYVAVRYFKHKHIILVYMFLSILFWSISVSSFKLFFL